MEELKNSPKLHWLETALNGKEANDLLDQDRLCQKQSIN